MFEQKLHLLLKVDQTLSECQTFWVQTYTVPTGKEIFEVTMIDVITSNELF